uniref:Photosystem I P700 chlorophyll a apoprotein A2 n=1 Tax=Cymopolia barbata TaxID=222010 RepID=A0A386JLZ3_9CHLO|nr:photosystem I P700 chlorophyll a apoprotein A2 [Cymopolia barbata]
MSAWDAFYLAVFWMLNTIGWVTFYFHWKNLGIWQGNVAQFNESSTYLMGWLRDYLWLNSSQLINGCAGCQGIYGLHEAGRSIYAEDWTRKRVAVISHSVPL